MCLLTLTWLNWNFTLTLSSLAIPTPVITHLPLLGEQQATLTTVALVQILDNHKTITQAGGADLRIALLARIVAEVIEHKFF